MSRLIRGVRDAAIIGMLSCAAVIILGFGLEIYFRMQAPFDSIPWPSQFDPQVGFIYIPGAEARLTNNFDYWTVQRANKWGFLDREPAQLPITDDECRVAFIGDSFVEAMQVPIEQKVQVVIERIAAKDAPQLKLSASAFGYSGTGQLNQLPFYDNFARLLKPRIVILVFVSNDFHNNSKVFESIRNGWDPDHAPRVFASLDDAGKMEIQPIDPHWAEKTLKTPPEQQTTRALWHGRFKQRSAFYRWFYGKIALLHPKLADFIAGTNGINVTAYHARQLQSRAPYRRILEDWDVARDTDIDEIFSREQIPPLFQQAVDYTGFALDQFLKRARQDRFNLVILATSELSDAKYGNGQLKRLTKLADQRNIPLVDQRRYIASVGGDAIQARFAHDGHWSGQGHRWAAEAILELLKRRPELCRGASQ